MRRASHSACRFLVVGLAALVATACGTEPPPAPVATPALDLSVTRAALGSPVDMTYRFTVADDAPPFRVDYRVLVHVLDSSGQLMWAVDHDPPTPTTAWQPGQTIEYTRTEFLPVSPYVGPAVIHLGLYEVATGVRAPLAGDDNGQREYRVGGLELLPESASTMVTFEEGWHQREVVRENPSVEWRWSQKDAAISIPNPGQNALLYLQIDQSGTVFDEPQQVTITVGDETVDTFTAADQSDLRRVAITAAQFGADEVVRIGIHVDKTFVPSAISPETSADSRELGLRVFRVVVQPTGN